MKFTKDLPGLVLSILIASTAMWIENLLPIHVIGSAVIAMFIGMTINHYMRDMSVFAPGIKLTSKKILKLAIILLGLSLNISTIINRKYLSIYLFT